MKKILQVLLIAVMLITGLFVLTGCGDDKTTSEDSNKQQASSSSESSSSSTSTEKKKKTKITDTEQEATVYYGTKGNFKETTLIVQTDEQSEDIIKKLIAEIGKQLNYEIEIESLTHGNKQLSINFAESFKPDEQTANKIYDSIYQTCYKAFGVTSDYFNLANGEVIKRSIND